MPPHDDVAPVRVFGSMLLVPRSARHAGVRGARHTMPTCPLGAEIILDKTDVLALPKRNAGLAPHRRLVESGSTDTKVSKSFPRTVHDTSLR